MNGKAPQQVRTLRIVILAMVVGMLALSVVALVVQSRIHVGDAQLTNVMLIVLGALIVLELPVYAIVRATKLGQLRAALQDRTLSDDIRAQLGVVYAGLTLVFAALFEGWGLLGAVSYLITGAWPALVAPAVAIIVLLFLLPSEDRCAQFVAGLTGEHPL